MNNSIPGWDFESDTSFINHQKNHHPIGHDQELVELLWQNGQVVMQSQTQRKPIQKTDASSAAALSQQQEDETSSWIQFPLIEDPLFEQQEEEEQELICANNFSQFSPCEVVEPYKPIRPFQESKFPKFDATLSSQQQQPNNMKTSSIMPAPRFHHVPDSSRSQKVLKFSYFGDKANNGNNMMSQSEAKECSVMTIGSSHCGSNQILQDQDVSKVSSSGVWATTTTTTTTFSAEHEALRDCSVQRSVPWSGKGKSEMMIEPTLTSSSGGSGSSSLGKTCSLSTGNHGLKRKGIDAAEESEEQSEATETKSAAANKASQRSGSSRRNRAAEVHNLSERRRRDRINEKMKTLQQLIPNSNKTDKASMLDEAIEYLKSLQLQLQVMWMGGSMAPMMFPGVQYYMSQMSRGNMAAPTLPPIQNPMQLQRMPLDQSMPLAHPQNQNLMCQNPVLGAFSNYQNQLQNSCLAEQYARYIGYHHLMQSASQPINVFGYGSQALQHSQTMTPPTNSSGPMSGAPSFDDAMSGKMGSSTFQQNS